MKTNRILILLTLLAVLCGHEAQAFYNASTGRWLSRDPVGEKGGLNLFAAMQNDPIGFFDMLGLQAGCSPCGPDVTAALKRTLASVETIFGHWSRDQQAIGCATLIDLMGGGAAAAWDIPYLAGIGFSAAGARCSRTVTFNGRCYYGGAVNYALWGTMFRLCNREFGSPYTYPNAILYVAAWKIWTYRVFGDEEIQALAFTTYGYLRVAPRAGISNCTPNAIPVRDYAFRWRWMPNKPH